MGTLDDRSGSDPSYPRRPVTVGSGGGACVVVGARESRVQGKGREPIGVPRRRKHPRVIKPMRLGSSAFNASSISGVGQTRTTVTETCGTGSPIPAISAAPGDGLPATKAAVPLGSTG
jgi:hypothetical protein